MDAREATRHRFDPEDVEDGAWVAFRLDDGTTLFIGQVHRPKREGGFTSVRPRVRPGHFDNEPRVRTGTMTFKEAVEAPLQVFGRIVTPLSDDHAELVLLLLKHSNPHVRRAGVAALEQIEAAS